MGGTAHRNTQRSRRVPAITGWLIFSVAAAAMNTQQPGEALVIVDIPTPEQWEARTKLPLAQRESTLTFIGEQIVEDKISGGGSFIIGHNVLTFYAHK